MGGIGHPELFHLSNFSAKPSQMSDLIPGATMDYTFSSGVMTITPTGAAAATGHMRRQQKFAGTDIPDVAMMIEYKTHTNQTATGQLFWMGMNAEYASGPATASCVGFLHASDQSPKDRATRRTGISTSSNGTASAVLNGTPTVALAATTRYRRVVRRWGSGSSRTYYTEIFDTSGVLVTGSQSNTGAQSDTLTDDVDLHFTVGCAVATEIYEIWAWDEAAPKITTLPTAQSTNTGSTATFVGAISPGDATSGHSVTLQWKRSPTIGGTYVNVSGGSGATTGSYTTGTLSMSDDQYYYKLVATDTTNGKTNETDPVKLTVVNTTGPVVNTGTTSTADAYGHTRADLNTSSSGLTLASSSVSNWSASKNGTALTIASVAVSGGQIRFTFSGAGARFLIGDSAIYISLLNNTTVKDTVSNIFMEAFSDFEVTNASTLNFGVAIIAPYAEVDLWIDPDQQGYDYIRVPVSRVGTYTGSLEVDVTNLVTGVTYTPTDPGTANTGFLHVEAGLTATKDLTGSHMLRVTLHDSYNTRYQDIPLYINDRRTITNKFQLAVTGTSTAWYFGQDGYVNVFNTLMAGTVESYPWTTLTEGAGLFGKPGEQTVGFAIGGVSGFCKEVHNWAVKNDVVGIVYTNSYLNDIRNGSAVWNDVKAATTLIYDYFSKNYRYLFNCPMVGAYDQTASGSGTIVSVEGSVVTLTGTSGTVNGTSDGSILITNNAAGHQVRDIDSVAANGGNWDFTLDSPFDEVPTGTFWITSPSRRDRVVVANAGAFALSEGGAEAITGGGRIIPVPTDILVYGRNNLSTDNLHTVHNTNGTGEHVRRIRDRGVGPIMLENAVVALSPGNATIPPDTTIQETLAETGTHDFGDYLPEGVLAGPWSEVGVGTQSNGLYTANGGPGVNTIRRDVTLVPWGGSPLFATAQITVQAGQAYALSGRRRAGIQGRR